MLLIAGGRDGIVLPRSSSRDSMLGRTEGVLAVRETAATSLTWTRLIAFVALVVEFLRKTLTRTGAPTAC
jgi:hypothetical protein